MDTSAFMVAFDVIVAILGVYIIARTVIMKKKHIIPTLFVQAEEIKNCKDVPAFVDYLFPKALVFGIVCVIFGCIDFCIDYAPIRESMKWLDGSITRWANGAMLVIFLAVWFWFSWSIKKGKGKYFKTIAL